MPASEQASPISPNRSFHCGLNFSISSIFHMRFHRFNLSSRLMASVILETVHSKQGNQHYTFQKSHLLVSSYVQKFFYTNHWLRLYKRWFCIYSSICKRNSYCSLFLLKGDSRLFNTLFSGKRIKIL